VLVEGAPLQNSSLPYMIIIDTLPASSTPLIPPTQQLYVRRATYTPPKHHSLYQAAASPHVSAEGQAAYHDWLLGSGLLRGEESALLQWAGQKQKDVRMRGRFSKTAGGEGTYRKATALEALVSPMGGVWGEWGWGVGVGVE